MRFTLTKVTRLTVPFLLLLATLAAATPPAIQINQPTSTDAEELCIAINPTNPSTSLPAPTSATATATTCTWPGPSSTSTAAARLSTASQ